MRTDELLDLDSLARLYWANEIMKNGDGLIFSSNYIYKDKGQSSKLVFGPAWDFDLSSGNPKVFAGAEGVKKSEGWWTRSAGIGLDLMRNSQIQAAVSAQKSSSINIARQLLNGGTFDLAMNSIVWGASGEGASTLRSWLNARLDWIERN